MSATVLGHLVALMFCMPVDETGRTARGQDHRQDFHGRSTLADVLDVSERSVSAIVAKFNALPMTTAKVRQFANHRTRFELSYPLHSDARLQVPAALCSIGRPAARGSATKAFLYLQTSAPWERNRNEVAEGSGIDRKAATQALADLQRLGLIDRNHDPELGKVRRPNSTPRPRGKSCNLRGAKTTTVRRDERLHELPTPSESLPPNTATEAEAGGTIQSQPQKPRPAKRPARETRRAFALLLADAGPVPESRATGRALSLIADKLAEGHTVETIAERYGGSLRTTTDPVGVIAHRIDHDQTAVRRTNQGHPMTATGQPQRPPVIHTRPLDPDQLAKLLDPDELAAIGTTLTPKAVDQQRNLAGVAAARSAFDRGGLL